MPDGVCKKQKQDNSNFLWILWEQSFDVELNGSLGKTLKLLRVFTRDLKFAKLSVINSLQAPPFPHSEWTNVLTRTIVNLDHIISGSFTITNDKWEVLEGCSSSSASPS